MLNRILFAWEYWYQNIGTILLLMNKDGTFQNTIFMTFTRTNIKSLTQDELQSRLLGLGLKKFRSDQILKWLYTNYALSFEDMTNVAKSERSLLSSVFFISKPTVARTEVSNDGTRKFLFKLEDKHTVESVLIPDENRLTLCISSQIGCRLACRFCLTGKEGFQRDLKAYEIADQVLEVSRILSRGGACGITNIVLMGMGEPLENFEEVVKAIKVITSSKCLGFSPRRVTLSSAGLVPEIAALAKAGVKVNLAISLNATRDEIRNRIMPVNKRYPIQKLLTACRRFPLEPRRRITFEYVMLKDVNDTEDDALRLVMLLKGMRCKVNLIPFNPYPGSEFKKSDDVVVRRFQKILLDNHYTASVRQSRGGDISAACGQLKAREPMTCNKGKGLTI
jgi:23S rRNA (adenine2503-C2)-methyltransferase